MHRCKPPTAPGSGALPARRCLPPLPPAACRRRRRAWSSAAAHLVGCCLAGPRLESVWAQKAALAHAACRQPRKLLWPRPSGATPAFPVPHAPLLRQPLLPLSCLRCVAPPHAHPPTRRATMVSNSAEVQEVLRAAQLGLVDRLKELLCEPSTLAQARDSRGELVLMCCARAPAGRSPLPLKTLRRRGRQGLRWGPGAAWGAGMGAQGCQFQLRPSCLAPSAGAGALRSCPPPPAPPCRARAPAPGRRGRLRGGMRPAA